MSEPRYELEREEHERRDERDSDGEHDDVPARRATDNEELRVPTKEIEDRLRERER